VSHGTDVGVVEVIDEVKDSGAEPMSMQGSRGKVLAARITFVEIYEGGFAKKREAATLSERLRLGSHAPGSIRVCAPCMCSASPGQYLKRGPPRSSDVLRPAKLRTTYFSLRTLFVIFAFFSSSSEHHLFFLHLCQSEVISASCP